MRSEVGVHCHVGSLEKRLCWLVMCGNVHCHVGSLENKGL